MCWWSGVKMKVQWFAHEFGKVIFVLYRETNHLEIKFWVKNTLVASYSWVLIALKKCWKVTFSHRFDNNFWTVRNFWCDLNVLESKHSELELEQKFCIFSMEIERVILLWICPTVLPEIRIPLMGRRRGVKMVVYQFAH